MQIQMQMQIYVGFYLYSIFVIRYSVLIDR